MSFNKDHVALSVGRPRGTYVHTMYLYRVVVGDFRNPFRNPARGDSWSVYSKGGAGMSRVTVSIGWVVEALTGGCCAVVGFINRDLGLMKIQCSSSKQSSAPSIKCESIAYFRDSFHHSSLSSVAQANVAASQQRIFCMQWGVGWWPDQFKGTKVTPFHSKQ